MSWIFPKQQININVLDVCIELINLKCFWFLHKDIIYVQVATQLESVHPDRYVPNKADCIFPNYRSVQKLLRFKNLKMVTIKMWKSLQDLFYSSQGKCGFIIQTIKTYCKNIAFFIAIQLDISSTLHPTQSAYLSTKFIESALSRWHYCLNLFIM